MPQKAVRAAGEASISRSMLSGSEAPAPADCATSKSQQTARLHRPVTFDSSQISSSSTITRNVPSSGIPITTPTPHDAAA